MPWYYPELDPDFKEALVELNGVEGSALDLCTGPGTQAMALAEMGLSVTGTDISISAIEQAAKQAVEQGLDITFLQNDILDNRLHESFDYIFDRGCFHVFPPEQRAAYVDTIAGLAKPGGYLMLKCFSHKEKSKEGPYRIRPEEIRERFGGEFEVLSVGESVFQSTKLDPQPIALFCMMKKR